ncbi:sigma-70 family RNA polymerase sigma factor [Nocardioides korecus]
MELTDDVAQLAAAGDPQAFREVYAALAPRVLGYLRSRGVEDPDGLTSEVFLGVYPRLPSLRGGAAGLRTLVFSVAHARSVDDVRRRARRPVDLSYEPEWDDRVSESAEHVAVSSLEAQRAVALMADLGEDQRAVVTLRILGDLTLEQTAEVTGKTVASVKQLQRRGLERLRTLMLDREVAR